MKTSSSGLIWLVIVVTMPTIIQSQLREQQTLNLWLHRPAKNLELHNNNVIIGSKNRILVLDETFGQVGQYNTCLPESKTCNNVNKVMVLNEDLNQLLICGTGKDGACEILTVPSLNVSLGSSSNTARISHNINRPVVGVITSKENVTLAVTNGPGVASDIQPYFPISVRKWSDLTANSKIKFDDDFKDFVIYYKDAFHIGNYSYFVTNQNKLGRDSKKEMISKVARVCSQDYSELHGYIDFEIGCQDSSGTDYNLIQHVEYLEIPNSDSWIIGVFTKGHNPEQMSGDSVICASQLNEVITTVNNTWEDFRLCEDRKSEPKRYFKDNGRVCNSSLQPKDYMLCENKTPLLSYNIGVRKLEMKFGYKVDHSRGDVTAVSLAQMSHANSPVLLVGTSKGKLIQTNIHVNVDSFHLSEYANHSLSNPYPVSAIRQKGDDTVYILTEAKIHKLTSTDCSEFTSCQSTMDGKNPLCGWCVLENKATRYGKGCGTSDNDWLSALDGTCLAFTPSPAAVSVGSFESMTITASHTLSIPDDATKQCVFRSDDFEKPSYTVDASFTSDTFTCQAPNVKVHTQASLDIVVKGFVLGTTSLMFFECGQFTTCGNCETSTGNECSWDTSSLTCKNGNAGIQSSCPVLNKNLNYVPSGKETDVELQGTNLNDDHFYKCMIGDECFNGRLDINMVICRVNLQTNQNTTTKKITVKYGLQSSADCSNMVSVDDPNDSTVTVYNCAQLADGDCSICCALNPSRYKCNWANDQCSHDATNQCPNNDVCPAPVIDRLDPADGPTNGGTLLTLTGKNFGHWDDGTISMLKNTDAIKMGGMKCNPSSDKNEYKVGGHPDTDYSKSFPTRIVFPTDGSSGEQNVTLKLRGKESNPVFFVYKLPNVTKVIPSKGPIAGGTKITLVGNNLSIGNKRVKVIIDSQFECTNAKAIFVHGEGSNITCTTHSVDPVNLGEKKVDLYIDKWSTNAYSVSDKFSYVDNPVVGSIDPLKGTLSGGTMLTVSGENLNNAHNIRLGFSESADNNVGEPGCSINSSSEVFCPVPRVKDREAIEEVLNGNRRKRSVDSTGNCLEIPLTLTLDGVQHTFTISYCRDPELQKFDNGVLLYESDDKYITIKGEFLTLVAKDSDFHITVGVGECKIIELKSTEITCHPPEESPADTEVRVVMGNIDVSLGRLEYAKDMQWMMIIIAVAAAAVAVVIVIIIVFVCYKLKLKKQAKKYEDDLKGMEMEIIDVARQEFLDMHTTMSSVNRNLVEQGFPYRDYQQYACNVMFAVDYLWTEPVVSNGKMTDDERIRANKGMETLESLIYNKYFLVSVIGTMEKQKKFFIREKSNLAGNLCSVLMGKMDYLNEVLCMLIKNLVQDSSGKKAQQKALFRRCESITEKLLSNWMSLCLYPHFKNHSGSPLYLLYVALLKTVEAGPIDAITNDSKYTLSEEKLLKKFSSSVSEESLKFESKTLTLNVVVNEGEEIFKCKVLDCDTISQVKCKCLSQIYVNYPASKLDIDPDELILEWHEGFSGSLRLQDHDNTSAQEGVWVRLNTLAHYNVKDESNLALVDPHSAEVMQQEDYVNLTNVNVEFGGCNGSMDSTDPLTSTNETQEGLEYWHLVKKEEEHLKKEKPAIDSLYLNRLITTKLSLKDYINTMFHAILDKDKVPPPTKFLLDYLDDLGEQFKVDNDTIHGWKSHSYAIRIWAALIKMPSLLFDVNIPTYIEQNLSVISQVFIESFSLSSQKFTKDSPSQKLIFHNEMLDCRERALGFYKNVKCDTQNHEELRQSLMEVNKLQQQTNINKTSALYRFYQQMKPYLENIVEDLATSKETSDLQLDKKLEKVMSIMEEEEDE